MCGTVILGMNSPKVIPGAYNSVETVASLNDLANGCGNTFSFTPTTDQAVIIPDEYYETLKIAKTKIPTHEMMIPVYGYMTEKGIPDDQKGYYEVNELKEPLNREQVLNSMYFDDTLVIWYSPDIRPSDIGDMLEAVEGETNIIIAPWEYEAGVLPAQRKVAFSYWGSSKTCEFFDSSSLRDFIQLHKDNPVPKSNHPIKLDPAVNGVLKEITVDDE